MYPGSPVNQTKWLVFRMIHVKDSLLPKGKVWSLDFLGVHYIKNVTSGAQTHYRNGGRGHSVGIGF